MRDGRRRSRPVVPVSCCLSATGIRFLGHPAPAGELGLPHGRLTEHQGAGPHRGCHVAHEQDATGQGALFTPGTAVRSRPVTIPRPAPAAFQRPVPMAPLEHPIGGGHLHEASSRIHLRSPIPPDGWSPPRCRAGAPMPTHRSSPCLWPPDGTRALGLLPRASHPAVTRDARRGGDGPLRTGPSTTPSALAEPPTAPPT